VDFIINNFFAQTNSTTYLEPLNAEVMIQSDPSD